MSYLGRKPIKIPKGVTIKISNDIDINGPLGSLSRTLDENIKIEINSEELFVKKPIKKRANTPLRNIT